MPKRNLIWIGAVLLAAVVAMWLMRNPRSGVNGNGWGAPSPLAEADRLIHDHWVGSIDEEAMYQAALAAMAYTLDEYSSYIPPEKAQLLDLRLAEGKVYGFGLELGEIDGAIEVVAPRSDSPADGAGILPGDIITEINGEATAGMPLCDVRARLAGGDGQKMVELTIVRNGVQLAPITLKMEKFAIETVSGLGRGKDGRWVHMIDEASGIAYIRISEFTEQTTADDLQRVMRELQQAPKLILDLRDNPGGSLEAAVNIADMFLRDGPIITKLFADAPPEERSARAGSTYYPDVAMVVLANSDTASAAEIVAGALAYNGRAVLLGQATKGKRSIQEVFPLPGGLGQLNLTTSRYVFGQARADERLQPGPIDNQPVPPQVPVEADPDIVRQLRRLRLVAALGPHSKTAHRLADTGPQARQPDRQVLLQQLIALDVQLTEAVNLLNSPQKMEAILQQARIRRQDASAPSEAPRR